jgi:hypothetical protein
MTMHYYMTKTSAKKGQKAAESYLGKKFKIVELKHPKKVGSETYCYYIKYEAKK